MLVVSVIIVTHNSENFINKCIECLRSQLTPPTQILIVDSGSKDTGYLKQYEKDRFIQLVLEKENIGFCKGNNIGYKNIDRDAKYVLFLNPDAFLSNSFLSDALKYMGDHSHTGALTGCLLEYDIKTNQPTGKYDSTGIFRKWYGRWYDRAQGIKHPNELYQKQEQVPAICGALMLCRREALDQVYEGNQIMDDSFYMYKEDIDLSLRLRKKGWTLTFLPSLVAYHCRGWKKNRTEIPKKLRLLSAKNEIRLHQKQRSPYLLYSCLKYSAVKLFNF